jgi:hypothetical protein
MLLPQDGALAYRYFKQPDEGGVTLTLTRTRHEVEKVAPTVVRRALVEIVNGEDGTANYRARLRLKTTERQRLQVDLPVNLELLGGGGVVVDGREVKLEKAGDPVDGDEFQQYYVNVARTKPSDEEFGITFHFRWKVSPYPGESDYFRGEMSLPLPVIGGRDEETSAPVQELRVAVWVPRDYALVGEPENFSLDRPARLSTVLLERRSQADEQELESWIGGEGGTSVSKQGYTGYVYNNLGGKPRLRVAWWNTVRMTVLISGAIVVIALILGRTSWENKLWVLLMAAFVACLAGLRDADWLAHALSAARYGLAFLVGWWLVRGLFGARNSINGALPATPTPAPVASPPTPPAPTMSDRPTVEGQLKPPSEPKT